MPSGKVYATREGYGHPMEWFAEEMERHGFLNGGFSQVKERFRVLTEDDATGC